MGFVLSSEVKNCFCLFNFLHVSHVAKKKNLVFLQVINIKLSYFCWYFFNIWPFIYWTLNKQSLETWPCVCCYCAYGLFLCFHSLWKKLERKFQEFWSMFQRLLYSRRLHGPCKRPNDSTSGSLKETLTQNRCAPLGNAQQSTWKNLIDNRTSDSHWG